MKWICLGIGLACVSVLVGCSTCSGPSDGSRGEFPLRIGNSWEYLSDYLQIVDIQANEVVLDTLQAAYDLEVARRETILDTLACYRVVETVAPGSVDPRSRANYYRHADDALYLHAYTVGGFIGFAGVTPKERPRPVVTLRGWPLADLGLPMRSMGASSASSALDDSLVVETPAVVSYEYPLHVGQQWTYREPGHPWAVDKRVVGETFVSVPAGVYECLIVQWLIDIFDEDGEWDEDIEWFDYVHSGQIVKRSLTVHDVLVWGDDPSEPIDTLDMWEVVTLTEADVR